MAAPTFAEEVNRRLVDTWEVMNALGLRSRDGVFKRVASGSLPEPVMRRADSYAFWDRDELERLGIAFQD